MKKLLIVAHMPSPNTTTLAKAICSGARHSDITNVETAILSPFYVSHDHVLKSDAIILFTTENFGYMSGALKDFFDRIYYPCLEKTESLPFALAIRAGLDGTGTDLAVHKITGALKWKEVQPTTLCKGEFKDEFVSKCEELGMAVAAGLDNEIF